MRKDQRCSNTSTGLLQPTSGRILFLGNDIAGMDEDELSKMQRNIGIAFQSSGLFNSMTVGDNVALPLREYGHMDEKLIDSIVRLKLSLVGLAAAQHLMPDELSGGMRKRAGLARAIALDPPVVYFDEPSAGLDPIIASGLDDLILNLRKLLGITFVIVTHELDSIRKVADRVLMLDRGKVIFTGNLEEAATTTVPESVSSLNGVLMSSSCNGTFDAANPRRGAASWAEDRGSDEKKPGITGIMGG